MASRASSRMHRWSRPSLDPIQHVQLRRYVRPSFAPKPLIDIKHIRRSPGLYSQNCVDRNYESLKNHSWQIHEKFEKLKSIRNDTSGARQRNNELQGRMKGPLEQDARNTIKAELKLIKDELSSRESEEAALEADIETLAWELPNLSSVYTPIGSTPDLIEYINPQLETQRDLPPRSHVDIGIELDLVDFTAAATTTGWGWYYLINEGALLEQALIQYTLSVARKRGWRVVSPPSIAYSHIAAACGFQPRDQNNEQQIYTLEQPDKDKAPLVLAGTAEIPLAGMKANQTIEDAQLPLKMVGVNRCYRAEAGARGVDTKGLYRVHEFTKVEMFAWTLPDQSDDGNAFGESPPEYAATMFEEMLGIQKEILESLGLWCRVLEMPSTDLGASATRKRDIEAYFPSRRDKDEGWGEVSSLSNCTDYQSRRLHTRVRMEKEGRRLDFPYTLNGTALAVPRVLACLLEVNWNEQDRAVEIPRALRPWMDGLERITKSTSA